MQIAIRVDSSQKIGSGHVARCRTLAAALRKRRADVRFICRSHPGNSYARLEEDGFPVHLLPAPHAHADGASYADWLGVDPARDAEETIAALGGVRPDWLIVDHYALSEAWERALRPHADRIMALDDIARAHAADMLLDQNAADDPEGRYRDRVPADCRLLLGPRYALLDETYAAAARDVRDRGEVRRILVFFGGTDSHDMTGRTLAALSHPDFAGIAIEAVVGGANPHAAAIEALARDAANIRIARDLPSLADALAAADLAIGAGGGHMWERCCLGVPAVVVSVAANQEPASGVLGDAGAVAYLGPAEKADAPLLRQAVSALIAAPDRRRAMSEKGRLLVDGRGAERAAEALMPTPRDALVLRKAEPGDCAFFFHLANDPLVRRHSFSTDPIPWKTHKAWYASKIESAASRLYVFEAHGLPVGQIRFDVADGTAVLSYALDAAARGRRLGGVLVARGLSALAAAWSGSVQASVKHENNASRAVFGDLGFHLANPVPFDRLVYVLEEDRLRSRFGAPG